MSFDLTRFEISKPPHITHHSQTHLLRFRQRHSLKRATVCAIAMSLPAIFSRHDATSYALTVAPYLPSLYDLPQKILAVISSPKGLIELYISTNPLVSATAFSLFIVPVLYVAQEVNKNYSQVDRVWSILPAFYNVHYTVYAHLADLPTQQADALAAVSVLWSVGHILFFGVD